MAVCICMHSCVVYAALTSPVLQHTCTLIGTGQSNLIFPVQLVVSKTRLCLFEFFPRVMLSKVGHIVNVHCMSAWKEK